MTGGPAVRSGNQRIFPWIGQGGRGYAMNEPFQALHNLPSADEVVRLLYKRDAFKKVPRRRVPPVGVSLRVPPLGARPPLARARSRPLPQAPYGVNSLATWFANVRRAAFARPGPSRRAHPGELPLRPSRSRPPPLQVAIHDFFRTATGTDGGTHPERGLPDSEQAGDAWGWWGASEGRVCVCG